MASYSKHVILEQAQKLTVTIKPSLSQYGEGLIGLDGLEIPVFATIPGEKVVVETRRTKRGRIYARLAEVLESSPNRVLPKCPHFGGCTGCQWQHIDYNQQLDLKARRICESLRRCGVDASLVKPVAPMNEPWHYRNHARFTVDRLGKVGFVNRMTRRMIPIDVCHIMHPWINSVLAQLQDRCLGHTQISVRYGVHTGDWLIQPKLDIAGFALATGQEYYHEQLLGQRFRVSSPSFFQVNTEQAEVLCSTVLNWVAMDPSNAVLDAYAGVGTFAVLLSQHVNKVIAVEESTSAIRDAMANTAGLPNVELVSAKVEGALASRPSLPDVVVLDPPRAGCHTEALEALERHKPARLVYVSCEPETLARDLAYLCNNGYRLAAVQPVDMFPQTNRVECVALLQRQQGHISQRPHKLWLSSASPRRRELLSCLGVAFDSLKPQVDEVATTQEAQAPERTAESLALKKAEWAADHLRNTEDVIVAADTMVVDDGVILGKPQSAEEGIAMLERLRGKPHKVITGLAVVCRERGIRLVSGTTSTVHMREYTDREIQDFIRSSDYADKAGAYAVQNAEFSPAAQVDGCYLNVVGLPLCELYSLLSRAAVKFPPDAGSRLPAQCSSCACRSIPAC